VKHIAGIDHAVVGVRDLEQAKSLYERLGFHITPRGREEGQGTANYCVMFEDDYIELLGPVEPDGPAPEREGMMALGLRSSDPDATHSAWRDAGLEADLHDLGRMLEPETELRFKKVALPPEATGGVPLFACTPLTPEPMRQPGWLEHPNGTIGIASLTAAVEEPGALIEPMSQVFGSTYLTETDDTLAVHTGHGVLLFATPDDLDMLHPHLPMPPLDSGPTLATLTLAVRDLEQTVAWLDAHEIPYSRNLRGTIGLAPELTNGVRLEFVEAAV